MEIQRTLMASFVIFSFTLSSAVLADVVVESESNDTFGTRNIFGSSTTEIHGSTTGVFGFDLSGMGSLTPGGIVDFLFPGLTPGDPFAIAIDNTVGVGFPDTTLGSFDEFGTLLDSDDDSSPLGDGLGSSLGGTVNADGTIHASVSGFADFDFDGIDDSTSFGHLETGDFSILVQFGVSVFDVDRTLDFFSITDLVPGSAFSIEVTDGNFDTILGLFDSAGTLIETDDDGGIDVFSRIDTIVDGTGTLNFAITGFDDFDFDNISDDAESSISSGDYVISVGPSTVPEPSGFILAGLAIFSLCLVHLKKRANGTASPQS